MASISQKDFLLSKALNFREVLDINLHLKLSSAAIDDSASLCYKNLAI